MSKSFRLLSPAKVNLGLKILGKRDDGYHEIDTLFQEIDWCDEIEIEPGDAWSLTVEGDAPLGDENLVSKAAHLFAADANIPCAARVHLIKNIPTGGGLGGGSSNAAVTLLGLNRLWNLNWPVTRLHPLAARIGSDCSFFLKGGLARGQGRGERLEWLSGKAEGAYLVVVPPFGVSTAWAYSQVGQDLTEVEKNVIFSSAMRISEEICAQPSFGFNDLESVVLRRYPELSGLKQQLLDYGAALSLLSGSGSTVFGIFSDSDRATHAAQQLGKKYTVRLCHPVSRERTVSDG